MKFGPIPVAEAVGAIAAHTVRAGDVVVKKGSTLSVEAVASLRAAGVASLVAVRFEPDDVPEDEAAWRLARAVAGAHVTAERPFTGRSNLFAGQAGVLLVDKAAVDGVNAIDEAVTLATLPALKPVVPGEMVGTVKIIPYAAPRPALDAALARVGTGTVLAVAPYRRSRVAAISTLLPGLKPTVVDKTLDVLAQRLRPAGATIVTETRVEHEPLALATALSDLEAARPDLVVIFGASAVADRRDVIPAAIEAAGGVVEHFGMPVDPGNLLLVGRMGAMPVIGAPGCARSPKENGFDWILHRLLADVPVTRADIAGLGVGGLLMEIVSRPQPRGGTKPGSAIEDER